MYKISSLCGCWSTRSPVEGLGTERAKWFVNLIKGHYQANPDCRLKANRDLVWQQRRKVRDVDR